MTNVDCAVAIAIDIRAALAPSLMRHGARFIVHLGIKSI
jgi:hypothetical protein